MVDGNIYPENPAQLKRRRIMALYDALPEWRRMLVWEYGLNAVLNAPDWSEEDAVAVLEEQRRQKGVPDGE